MAENISAVILVDDDQALVRLCGISLLERSLRILQRLGFKEATVLTQQAELIRQHLAPPSWPRAEISVSIVPRPANGFAKLDDQSAIVLRGDRYHDPRLIRALCEQPYPTLLFDADPPASLRPLLAKMTPTALGYMCGAALIRTQDFAVDDSSIFARLTEAAQRGEVDVLQVGALPTYLVDLRRDLRPLWFPTPAPAERCRAEGLLLDAARNGTLDLPAKVHAPIETWIIARLCRTSITPNQITLFTAAISAGVTVLFSRGHLLTGTLLALAVGVLDGLDGKQARVKVETTPLGKREHALDYFLELSWWTALAFHFHSNGALPSAFLLLALFVGSDLMDRFAKKLAKEKTGRNLDDLAPMDRFVRLVGGRRNIYIWLLAAGLALGAADQAFRWLCYWGAGTAAVHLLRVFWIRRSHRLPE